MFFKFFKIFIFLLTLLDFCCARGQNVQVDAHSFSPQQLIESILIDSGCIENVEVTNVVGGNFEDGDKSYGYFYGNGSSFPFEKGLVLSTGKLKHVPGPNNTLSDDDAPGWFGDRDLEEALGISGTVNATIIEFDFLPRADNISFRYIFASEEYQEGDRNTCRYSDAFAFLIKPVGGEYTNIALVPGTDTPVLVTTVHSGIPGACPPINERYFGGWNGRDAPINFNGQTKVLLAESPVTVNQAYHIKLVIADQTNYRYDSAVFLEGGSFNISANLGGDRSFATDNPLCPNETYLLDATPEGNNPISYKWFRNGSVISGETSAQLLVSSAGIYKVEIDYGSGCVANDEVLIEYSAPVSVRNTELLQCEPNGDGRATFNLFDSEPSIVDGDAALQVYSFHKSFADAENNIAPIQNARRYYNTQMDEMVFARVVSNYGCVGVAEVILKTTTESVSPFSLTACSNLGTPGFATFNLSSITSELKNIFGSRSVVTYYISYRDAILKNNPISTSFINTRANGQTIFGRVSGKLGCLGTTEVNLNVVNTPEFEGEDTFVYCNNTFPQTITLSSGLLGSTSNISFLWSTGETTPEIRVNESGSYSVTVTRKRRIDGEEYSCTGSRNITIIESEPAEVSYSLSVSYGNQTLTITISGIGDYLFSLDNSSFQQSPIFENLKPGIYELSVMDQNGCDSRTMTIHVLGFPNFFTPNDDGHNDYWQIKALDRDNLQLQYVVIYDRFGKLIHILDLNGRGWDGMYNGKPMPSSDYWFKALLNDGSIHKGHFSLKR